jgi:hypothetical protein
MPQRASVFCNFYIRVDRETLVSERALDVGSVAFKAMSTNIHLMYIFPQKIFFLPTGPTLESIYSDMCCENFKGIYSLIRELSANIT